MQTAVLSAAPLFEVDIVPPLFVHTLCNVMAPFPQSVIYGFNIPHFAEQTRRARRHKTKPYPCLMSMKLAG